MMNWAKQQLANVAGTQEPIYGPTAVRSVTEQAETTPYTLLKREDMKWATMDSTNVETASFYFNAESGHIGFAQVIYSNVAGLRTTVQFNTKIFYPKSENRPPLFCTDQVKDVDFSDDKCNFYAENCAIELSEDGKTYTIKSMVNEASIVNMKITQAAPAFQVGTDGTTYFGPDPEAPWGTMRHSFWPRNKCEGSIVTEDGPITFNGNGLYVYAIQGMKPHHAAAKWKFADFQGPKYSAIMMEFITPPSYGSTVVTVGGLVKDGEIITAGSSCFASHSKVKEDPENDWPEPEEVTFEWKGKTQDGKDVEAVLKGPLNEKIDRIDVMFHVPGFVKKIVAGAAGTKPYIYQYSPTDPSMPLKIKIGDEETTEEGVLFSEATFICP